jgi:hypothetical protein
MQTRYFSVESFGATVGLISDLNGAIAVYDIYHNWLANIKYDRLNLYHDQLDTLLGYDCIIVSNRFHFA